MKALNTICKKVGLASPYRSTLFNGFERGRLPHFATYETALRTQPRQTFNRSHLPRERFSPSTHFGQSGLSALGKSVFTDRPADRPNVLLRGVGLGLRVVLGKLLESLRSFEQAAESEQAEQK